MDAVQLALDIHIGAIDGGAVGCDIGIVAFLDDKAGAVHLDIADQFGVLEVQDGDLVGGVEDHPELAVDDGHVVGGVAHTLGNFRIGGSEDIGVVFVGIQVYQIQGGSGRPGSLIENEELGIFTYFFVDTREMIGGVFFGTTHGYRREDQAENQQCFVVHCM